MSTNKCPLRSARGEWISDTMAPFCRSASAAAALLCCLLPTASAFSVGTSPSLLARYCTTAQPCVVRLQASGEENASATAAAAEPPSWFDEDEAAPLAPPPPPAPLEEEDKLAELLSIADVENTMWDVVATPREDGWLLPGDKQQQFTLLASGEVVWGGEAGGFGTGGRWTLKDGLLEVIRTTSGNFPGLSLVTGRDYYMAAATVDVNEELQFKLSGIIRSYNAIYPVAVIADFKATRRPGRFVRDVEED